MGKCSFDRGDDVKSEANGASPKDARSAVTEITKSHLIQHVSTFYSTSTHSPLPRHKTIKLHLSSQNPKAMILHNFDVSSNLQIREQRSIGMLDGLGLRDDDVPAKLRACL